MAKTDKAEKSRDESRSELEKLKVEASKLKDLFQNEWNEVVERQLKEQNADTGIEDKHDTIKLVTIKDDN